jgi:hypothetical protein
MSWALIATLILFSKPEVIVIHGFTSEETCRYSGIQQEVVLRDNLKVNTKERYTFTCIEIK